MVLIALNLSALAYDLWTIDQDIKMESALVYNYNQSHIVRAGFGCMQVNIPQDSNGQNQHSCNNGLDWCGDKKKKKLGHVVLKWIDNWKFMTTLSLSKHSMATWQIPTLVIVHRGRTSSNKNLWVLSLMWYLLRFFPFLVIKDCI